MKRTVGVLAVVIMVALIAVGFKYLTPKSKYIPVSNSKLAPVVVKFDTERNYTPDKLLIKVGQSVQFVNTTQADYMWPASDPHPVHTGYSAFDPREPIGPGQTWTFAFDKPGAWGFHDHLRSSRKGTITVVE